MKLTILVDLSDPDDPEIVGYLSPDGRPVPPFIKPPKTVPDSDSDDDLVREEGNSDGE